MKLNGKMLVSLAMVVAAMGATGCKRSHSTQEESSPAPAAEANPAPAAQTPAAEGTAAASDEGAVVVRAPAPPALRVETQPARPSARHVWQNGYWRWNNREYVWVGGYWDEPGVY